MQATERIRQKVADPKMISFPDLLLLARQGIKETVMEKMRVFGSSHACVTPGVFCDSCGACVTALFGETCAASAPVSTNKRTAAVVRCGDMARTVASVVKGDSCSARLEDGVCVIATVMPSAEGLHIGG
jgi:hypothetical protein